MSAGFRWTVDSQPRVFVMNKPMAFEPAPAHRKNRWAVDSLDYAAREVISIASGRMEVEATIKFEKNAQGLVDMLRDAADGNVVTYYPDLSNGTGYALWLVSDNPELSPQAGNWSLGNYEVRTRWRDASASGTSIAPLFERLLFRLDAGHFPMGYSFTRSGSVGPYIDSDGVLKNAAENIARIEWVDLDGDGARETPGLLIEPQATNDLGASADIDASTTSWVENAAWTQSDATSFISGETAQYFTNDGSTGSHNVAQNTPALVGTPIVVSAIVEQDDALVTALGLRDETAGDWVVLGTYTWATGSIVATFSGAGSSVGVRATTLATTGPNGGKLVRLEVYGTADNPTNSGRVYIYPTGTTTNSLSAYVHHAQHEDGTVATSPIVTADAGTATRNADTFYAPFTHAPQEMTIYAKIAAHRDTGTAGVVQIGTSTGGADERVGIQFSSSRYRGIYNSGAGLVSANTSTEPSIGQPVELVLQLASDGDITFQQSINGAAVESGTNATGGGLPPAWDSQRIYIGSLGAGSHGKPVVPSVKVAAGVKTMAEMRAL